MTVEGLDRVVIGVRDMDRAVSFFQRVLGATFIDLDGPQTRALGQQARISPEMQLELISPLDPLPDSAPAWMFGLVDRLKDRAALLLGISYKVADADEFSKLIAPSGFHTEPVAGSDDYGDNFPLRDIREVVADKEDTLGLLMSFISYEPK